MTHSDESATHIWPPASEISRRALVRGAAAAGLGLTAWRGSASASPLDLLLATAGTPIAQVDELVIDLSSEPANIDPATTYDVDGWSIVHSLYDSLVQYDVDGKLQGVAAESLTQLDPLTWEVKLRAGQTFHNGEALGSASIGFSQQHIANSKTSTIKGNFATITAIKTVDVLTARISLSTPSPWLPAQIALWMVVLPPVYAAANDINQKPVGSGPYSFVEWKSGEHIVLAANPNYPLDSPKGQPIAKKVTFRFVSEASTRVADLLSGSAGIIRGVPVDQIKPIADGGATTIANEISGISFIRIPTDVAPFSDVRVRQALNYAVDVEGIVSTLNGGYGKPLVSFFPERGLGYSAAATPYAYDPDKAKALLKEAGVESFETTIDYASSERSDLVEAIAAQLSDVGIKTTARAVEIATFNGSWKDQKTSPLRWATWRPMFDPFTFLNLIVNKDGYLSRFRDDNVQALIDAAAIEPDIAKRTALYVQLNQKLHDSPAAIYLWSQVSIYGIAKNAPAWTTRPDDIVLPTRQS